MLCNFESSIPEAHSNDSQLWKKHQSSFQTDEFIISALAYMELAVAIIIYYYYYSFCCTKYCNTLGGCIYREKIKHERGRWQQTLIYLCVPLVCDPPSSNLLY